MLDDWGAKISDCGLGHVCSAIGLKTGNATFLAEKVRNTTPWYVARFLERPPFIPLSNGLSNGNHAGKWNLADFVFVIWASHCPSAFGLHTLTRALVGKSFLVLGVDRRIAQDRSGIRICVRSLSTTRRN